MTEYALTLANDVDTAPRVRAAQAMGLAPGSASDKLAGRTGVRPGGGGTVTVSAGTMGVTVSAFSGWIDGGSSDAQGGYVVVNDAAKTLTLDDGHATLARVDTIAMVVRENAYDGSGATACGLEVVKGTPGGGAPTLPATALPLRDVNVPAGLSTGTGGLASGNLAADRRTYLSALGGILPVGSATERDALAVYPGLAVFRTDIATMQVYSGTGWDTHYAGDTGWIDPVGLGGGDVGNGWVCGTLGTSIASRIRRIGNRVTIELQALSVSYSHAAGNVPDVNIGALPTGFRPSGTQYVSAATTKGSATLAIGTNGMVTLRTLSADVDTLDKLFVSHTFLTD